MSSLAQIALDMQTSQNTLSKIMLDIENSLIETTVSLMYDLAVGYYVDSSGNGFYVINMDNPSDGGEFDSVEGLEAFVLENYKKKYIRKIIWAEDCDSDEPDWFADSVIHSITADRKALSLQAIIEESARYFDHASHIP